MIPCWKGGGSYGKPDPQYFYCAGGLGYGCMSYITFVGGKFKQVKNPVELVSVVGDISSPEEAQALAIMANAHVSASLTTRDGVLPVIAPHSSAGGFSVSLYRRFCAEDVYKVQFLVSRSGSLTEASKEVVYKAKDAESGLICD